MSLRLDPELERRLREAAAAEGVSVSEFVRRASSDRADAVLDRDILSAFDDVVGVVHAGGGVAARSGEAFADLMNNRHPRR